MPVLSGFQELIESAICHNLELFHYAESVQLLFMYFFCCFIGTR